MTGQQIAAVGQLTYSRRRGVLDDLELRRIPRAAVELPVQRRTEKGKSVAERLSDLSMGGLTLLTADPVLPEARVELVIRDGNRDLEVQGTVMSTRLSVTQADGVAGIRFDPLEPLVETQLRDLLIRTLGLPDGRRAGRRLQVAAEVYWQAGTQAHHLELANLGRGGALLKGPTTPPIGSTGLVVLRRDDSDMISVPAQVVWSRAGEPLGLMGVKFPDSAEVAEQVSRVLDGFVSAPVPATPSEAPSIARSFRVGPLIGQGASSRVFRAEALRGERAGTDVALWQVDQELADLADWHRRFWATLELQRTFKDPAVVSAYEANCNVERSWLVMEPVIGMSLDRVLSMYARSKQRPSPPAVLSVGIGVLETLGRCHAHQVGGKARPVIHGDLRSSRILLTYDGDVKLQPFGGPGSWDGAKQLTSPEALPYLAPEVLQGGVPSEKSDLYQVGVVLYRALTGVHPFTGASPRIRRPGRRPQTPRPSGWPPPGWLPAMTPRASSGSACSTRRARPRRRPTRCSPPSWWRARRRGPPGRLRCRRKQGPSRPPPHLPRPARPRRSHSRPGSRSAATRCWPSSPEGAWRRCGWLGPRGRAGSRSRWC